MTWVRVELHFWKDLRWLKLINTTWRWSLTLWQLKVSCIWNHKIFNISLNFPLILPWFDFQVNKCLKNLILQISGCCSPRGNPRMGCWSKGSMIYMWLFWPFEVNKNMYSVLSNVSVSYSKMIFRDVKKFMWHKHHIAFGIILAMLHTVYMLFHLRLLHLHFHMSELNDWLVIFSNVIITFIGNLFGVQSKLLWRKWKQNSQEQTTMQVVMKLCWSWFPSCTLCNFN